MSPVLTPAQLVSSLEWRYATKAFAKDPLPATLAAALLESLRLAPSSYGLQPWKFFVIENPAIRAQLRPLSWNQSQITDASHLIVLAHRTEITEKDVNDFFNQMVSERKADAAAIEPYRQLMLTNVVQGLDAASQRAWAARQVYLALGQLMTSAATLGVDTCPIEGLDPVKYDEILGLAGSGYQTIVACAVGYRSPDDKYAGMKKIRFPASRVIARI